eukprot:7873818-Pyramimonas_sp.AAC.1
MGEYHGRRRNESRKGGRLDKEERALRRPEWEVIAGQGSAKIIQNLVLPVGTARPRISYRIPAPPLPRRLMVLDKGGGWRIFDGQHVGGYTPCLVHVERALVDVPSLRIVAEMQQYGLAQDRNHGPENAQPFC